MDVDEKLNIHYKCVLAAKRVSKKLKILSYIQSRVPSRAREVIFPLCSPHLEKVQAVWLSPA